MGSVVGNDLLAGRPGMKKPQKQLALLLGFGVRAAALPHRDYFTTR